MAKAKLANLIDLICLQAEIAEDNVRNDVKLRFPHADEEAITNLFQLRLSESLQAASDDQRIANAFAKDLLRVGFTVNPFKAGDISRGLIAQVSWHPRHIESRSGGDFGLVLVRPKLKHGLSEWEIEEGSHTGLLVQAKRKLYGEPWGDLTDNQKEVLKARLNYTSLVLYQFNDIRNTNLTPFKWRKCEGKDIQTVTGWLENNPFRKTNTLSTSEILRQLGDEKAGTSDQSLINSHVIPPGAPTLEVIVTWREGEEPTAKADVLVKPKEEQKAYVFETLF